MMQDQWKGRIEIALGTAIEWTGTVLHSAALKERGLRRRTLGYALARYGRAIAAVIRRSQ